MAPRAAVTVTDSVAIKRYRNPADAYAEIDWYQNVGGRFAPRIIDADPERGLLVIEAHPVAHSMSGYRPVDALAELLHIMEAEGLHHRDVHPGNIVASPTGPLLIDWETAIAADAPSYDLYGPEISGVTVPVIHAALPSNYTMWWGSTHRMSIANVWRTRAPLPPAPQQR